MSDKLNSFLKSRRFWAALGGLVAVTGKEFIPALEQFSDAQIIAGVLMIGFWIYGESLRSSEGPKE